MCGSIRPPRFVKIGPDGLKQGKSAKYAIVYQLLLDPKRDRRFSYRNNRQRHSYMDDISV